MAEQPYFPIYPQVLRIDSVLPFDIYAKVRTGQFDILHHADNPYPASVHGSIYRNNVPAVYVKTSSFNEYNTYLYENIEQLFITPFITTAVKANILHGLLTVYAKQALDRPTEESVSRYKRIITIVAPFVFEDPEALNRLMSLTSSRYFEHNHLVNVGIYALGLSREVFSDEDRQNLDDIAAGFFLHDIGKSAILRQISLKKARLTGGEWELMKRHPEEGCRILKRLKHLTVVANIIISQHHERHDGSGYPHGEQGDYIHTYAKICTIADTFDALTSQRPYRDPVSSFEALNIMKDEMRNEFDRSFFAKFVMLFKRQ